MKPGGHQRRRSNQKGFTLIEMVVALAILAVITLLTYGAFRVQHMGRMTYSMVSERFEAARIALSKLRDDLSQAFISKHINMEKSRITFFRGTSNRLEFTYMGHLRIMRNARECDQGKVAYFLENSKEGEGQTLYRQEEIYLDDKDEVREGRKLIIADNVKKLKFDYWDSKAGAMEQPDGSEDLSAGDWEDSWDTGTEIEMNPNDIDTDNRATPIPAASQGVTGEQAGRLPEKVRIQMTLHGNNDKEYYFETQVVLRLTNPLDF